MNFSCPFQARFEELFSDKSIEVAAVNSPTFSYLNPNKVSGIQPFPDGFGRHANLVGNLLWI